MASGVPVLASEEGALPEIVTPGETGRLVDKNDSRKLSEALTEMLSDRGRLEEMGRRARESVVGRFTIGRQVEVIERLYRLVLD
jgi:mannosyltransferase